MPIVDLQRRQRELGRIRMGDKGGKGQPQKLSHFRLTSPARHLLDEAANLWGGEVKEWKDAPSEGQFELYTATDVLPIVIPPGPEPTSQWYEQWTGGGATHRCDGVTNFIDDSPCSCDQDARACKVTTRINVMLPDLPDIGVWRLETHGINAAMELTGTIDVIQMASHDRLLEGRLRIEHRTSKKEGQTRKFIVPVIDLDLGVKALMNGGGPEVPALETGEVREIEAPSGHPGDGPIENEPPPGDLSPKPVKLVNRAQIVRMFAVASDSKVPEETVKQIILKKAGVESSKEIPADRYDAVIDAIAQEALDLDAAHTEEAPEEDRDGQVVLERLKAKHEDPG